MTVDVEDYFHVSVFEGVVPREQWPSMESRGRGQHRAAARPVRRVRRQGHVLRARLGGGALSARWCGRSSPRDTNWRHTAMPTGWSTTRRRRSFGDDVRAREGAAGGCGGRGGARLPGAQLLGDATVDVGARCAARGRLPLRREHLSDPPRSVRHPRRPPVAASRGDGAAGRSSRCPAPPFGVGRHQSPGRRRRLLPHPALRVDAMGHGSRQRAVERQPAVFYLHPWEIDPEQPRLPAAMPWGASGTTATSHKTEARLRALMRDFRFAPLNAVLAGCAS